MEIFDFTKNYVLGNERVLLRPLQRNDYEHLLTYALNEPDIWYYNAGGPETPERLQSYIDFTVKQREKELEYPFIVFDKKTNQYAGCTRYYDIRVDRQTIQLGFTWYGKAFQRTGLNRHCKHLLLGLAFDRLNMLRVGLAANIKNERSINAMKAIGCTVEGVWRSTGFDSKGERIDSILLSMLKHEWDGEWKEKLRARIAGYK